MAWPEPAGSGLGLKYDNCVASRAGPGRNFSTGLAGSAPLLRAPAGPGPQIAFAGRAWAYISGPCRALVYKLAKPSNRSSTFMSHMPVINSLEGQILTMGSEIMLR